MLYLLCYLLLKILIGGTFALAGFFGMAAIILGTLVKGYYASLGKFELDLVPAILYGILFLVILLAGIYIIRLS